MICPKCRGGLRVVDSRPTVDGTAIYRRRECFQCEHRISTYEMMAARAEALLALDPKRAETIKQVMDGLSEQVVALQKQATTTRARMDLANELLFTLPKKG